VQRAPGFPCALCFLGAEGFTHSSGTSRREIAESYLNWPFENWIVAIHWARTRHIPSRRRPARPGDPVFQRRLWWNREAAAYWIPRWSLLSGSPKARPGGGVWRPCVKQVRPL